jgi:hypothetical protein
MLDKPNRSVLAALVEFVAVLTHYRREFKVCSG